MPKRKKPQPKTRPTKPRADSAIPQKRNLPKPRRQWKPLFLQAFGETGNVRHACFHAGIDRTTAYKAYHSDEAFKKAWQTAEDDAADLLEAEAHRRAVVGVDEPIVYEGGFQYAWYSSGGEFIEHFGVKNTEPPEFGAVLRPLAVKKYSDTLLVLLLKARRPGRFRENVKVQHTGANGGPVEIETTKKPAKEIDFNELAANLEKLALRAASGRVPPDGHRESVDPEDAL